MQIIFPDILPPEAHVIYIGDRPRFATMTSVSLIDDRTLLACHLWGKKLFLVNFDLENNTYNFIDSINTTFQNKIVWTDLMDFRDNLIVVSNFEDGSQTLFKLDNNKISHFKDIKFGDYIQCHGVKFVPIELGFPNLYCATYTHRNNKTIQFIDYVSNELYFEFRCDFLPQDVCFWEDKIVIISRADHVSHESVEKDRLSSDVLLYSLDLSNKQMTRLDSFHESGHLDCIVRRDNKFYSTNQYEDSVITYEILDNKINKINTCAQFSFPHGISVLGDLVSVSNYGNNTISLLKNYDI